MTQTSDRIIGSLMAGIGLGCVVEGVRIINVQDPNVVSDVLGPGPYVIVLGMLLTFGAAAHLLTAAPAAKGQSSHDTSDTSDVKVLLSIAVLAGYIILIDILGYALATLLFFFLYLRVLGCAAIATSAVLAAGAAVSFYLLFIELGGMSFPRGLF